MGAGEETEGGAGRLMEDGDRGAYKGGDRERRDDESETGCTGSSLKTLLESPCVPQVARLPRPSHLCHAAKRITTAKP